MTRSESDSWDLATSVGTTATMVAAVSYTHLTLPTNREV